MSLMEPDCTNQRLACRAQRAIRQCWGSSGRACSSELEGLPQQGPRLPGLTSRYSNFSLQDCCCSKSLPKKNTETCWDCMLASNQSFVGVQTPHLHMQVRAETAEKSKRGTNRQESTLADQRCCPLACLSQTSHSSASYPARKAMVASCPHSSLPSPPAGKS